MKTRTNPIWAIEMSPIRELLALRHGFASKVGTQSWIESVPPRGSVGSA